MYWKITTEQALRLLRKYNIDSARIAHCRGVSYFAYSLAEKIARRNPKLRINPEKVRLAALLHDIGRGEPGDHEINSVIILKREGLDELASLVIHGTIYEIFLLRGKNDPSLLPHSVENKIVAYADSRYKDHLVSMEERWAEIEKCRSNQKEKLESLQMAKERFRNMEKELLKLAGKDPESADS
ncbi:MAG: HD domain-containing protein [Chitinispirillaceae bacterium]